ncbi:MAG: nitrate reductase [Deltaproteobacteria bacterium]|nr:nitrate reductase [Deltaproteobacteria bacterium]
MGSFADFVEGPLLWAAWIVFIGGTLYRFISFFTLSAKRDKAIYEHWSWKYVLLSWVRFLLPINQTVAKNPVFAILSYIFHICLIVVPLFVIAHIMYWEESIWGWSWYSLALPDSWAPYLSWVVIGIGALFFIRRLARPEVRILSTPGDYILLVLIILPFLTGYLTSHTYFLSDHMRTIHILSGEAMLVAIPLSKLSHFIMFFPSRMAIAVEWGRRGYSA